MDSLERMAIQAVRLVIETVVPGGPFILMQFDFVVSSLMADHTALAVSDVTGGTMPVLPVGAVGPRRILGMAGVAVIRFMTGHAAAGIVGAVPFIPQGTVRPRFNL